MATSKKLGKKYSLYPRRPDWMTAGLVNTYIKAIGQVGKRARAGEYIDGPSEGVCLKLQQELTKLGVGVSGKPIQIGGAAANTWKYTNRGDRSFPCYFVPRSVRHTWSTERDKNELSQLEYRLDLIEHIYLMLMAWKGQIRRTKLARAKKARLNRMKKEAKKPLAEQGLRP